MATTATATPGKTSFVKEFLNANPQGNTKTVNEAWKAAGMKGTISHPIISQVRKQLGLTGNLLGTYQERRQGKGSPQHAQDSNRYTRQDQLREGVPQRPSPRHHQNRERGLAGCRIRGHNQPHLGQQDESEADRQSAWELQNSRQGEVSPQNAQNSNRHTRQDQLLERVPPRPSRRQRQSGNEAWTAAGFDGTISETLVYKARASLGLTGNLSGKTKAAAEGKATPTGKKLGRPRKEPTAPVTGQPRGRKSNRSLALTELEADIDRLIFKVMGVGDLTEIEDSLRQARRLLYGALTER